MFFKLVREVTSFGINQWQEFTICAAVLVWEEVKRWHRLKGQSKERKESGKVEERVSQGDTARKPNVFMIFPSQPCWSFASKPNVTSATYDPTNLYEDVMHWHESLHIIGGGWRGGLTLQWQMPMGLLCAWITWLNVGMWQMGRHGVDLPWQFVPFNPGNPKS